MKHTIFPGAGGQRSRIFCQLNVPGYPDPQIMPWTRKPLRELFAFVLHALGEKGTITLRSGDEKVVPWVDWCDVDPAAALDELCRTCGYRAVYDLGSDQITVEPLEP